MRNADIEGIFTVILYGGTYSQDPETVAILDIEDDQYTFEPLAPGYKYTMRSSMTAGVALNDSLWHVSRHAFYSRPLMKKILDESGRVIGYELRPLFNSVKFGRSDVLDVVYEVRDEKVTVLVKMKNVIKRRFRNRAIY